MINEKVCICVDFNEMVDFNIVMLSQTDVKMDCQGNEITLYEGMPVCIFEEDVYEDGTIDYLVAEGIVIQHNIEFYPFYPHVKWFCLIDSYGVQNMSKLEKSI